MRLPVNGVRLFVDVEGPMLVPTGPRMVARPVVVALHGGPGADHSTLLPPLTPLSELARGRDRATVVRIAGAAHTVLRDQPETAHRAMREFLASLAAHPRGSTTLDGE